MSCHRLTYLILLWYLILCLFTLLLEKEDSPSSKSAPELVIFYFHFVIHAVALLEVMVNYSS